jgi:hypothetical protein
LKRRVKNHLSLLVHASLQDLLSLLEDLLPLDGSSLVPSRLALPNKGKEQEVGVRIILDTDTSVENTSQFKLNRIGGGRERRGMQGEKMLRQTFRVSLNPSEETISMKASTEGIREVISAIS